MFEYTYRERIWNWTCRYPLWYLGVLLANLFAMVILLPYRVFNTYVLRREVDLSGWAYVLSHFVDERYHRTQPLYRPQEHTGFSSASDLTNYDVNSLYPTSIKKGNKDGDI